MQLARLMTEEKKDKNIFARHSPASWSLTYKDSVLSLVKGTREAISASPRTKALQSFVKDTNEMGQSKAGANKNHTNDDLMINKLTVKVCCCLAVP